MIFIKIINNMLANSMIGILLFCVVFNFRHASNSIHRNFLCAMLLYWTFIFSGYVFMFNFNKLNFEFNQSVASMKLIIMGIPSYASIIIYPIIMLHPHMLKFKSWVKLSIPMFIVLAIYFGWHAASGINPFYEYPSLEIFMQNISTTPVILRLIVVLSFIAYIVLTLWTTWRIVPLYSNYIIDNVADNSYNVDWVRTLIILTAIVGIFYFSMLFTSSPYVNMVYLTSVLTLFTFITSRSILSKTFEGVAPLDVRWNSKQSWHISSKSKTAASADYPTKSYSKEDILEIMAQIDEWMDSSKAYTRIDFTTQYVFAAFPKLSNEELKECSKINNETFQSYVRRKRITLACQIIEQDCENTNLKHVYGMTGFSHYSSFSRSFHAVTGKSPSDFINEVKSNPDRLKKAMGGG